MRGHGPTGRYFGRYGDAALAGWAGPIAGRPDDAFVHFGNDIKSAAPQDAARLVELVAQ